MDRARELVRGMESLDERMRQQQERQGQQGQEGQQGQQAQGQRGQQGQEGQQGQQGQGQRGQQGQEGQQGQQGQGQRGQQGQEGRQGQQGQGGQQQDGRQMGGGSPGYGTDRGGQSGGQGGVQGMRELRERLNDARALRRELAQRGEVDLSQLDRAIGRMENLGRMGSNRDERSERELRTQVIEGLRAFEFTLGRALGELPTDKVLVDRAGEVPPEYRKYVEEYYRSLGRTKPKN